jgi:hypothetical protein
MEHIITSYTNKKLKKIVNLYQLKYKNSVAQGFGDYLRGSFCLLQICKLLNIEFEMNIKNHPMSKFLDIPLESESENINYEEIERYMNSNYIAINNITYKKDSHNFLIEFINHLNTINSNTYYCFCNSFPIRNKILDEGRNIIKKYINPNKGMQNNIELRLKNLNLLKKQFNVIHIRLGDKYLLDKSAIHFTKVDKITNIMNKMNFLNKIVIISDNNEIKLQLKKLYPSLIIQIQEIIHLGETENPSDESVMMTLLDFYLMSYANEIIAFTPYPWGSGFSQWCSIVYNIPYQKFII